VNVESNNIYTFPYVFFSYKVVPNELQVVPNVASVLLLPGYVELNIWWKQFVLLSFQFSPTLSVNSTSLG